MQLIEFRTKLIDVDSEQPLMTQIFPSIRINIHMEMILNIRESTGIHYKLAKNSKLLRF